MGGSSVGDRATDLPFASVIVPVKDGFDLLVGCVRTLLDQDYPADRFEIIVADNGSAASPATVLPKDPRLAIVHESKPGSYAARNAALAVARGEILAFTDADCVPDRRWLRVSAQYLSTHPTVAMIGGRVALTYQGGVPRNGPEWYEFAEGFQQEKYLASGFAVTANMVTRRSEFDRVGLFDDSLLSGGDAEWGRRVRSAGGCQAYVDAAVIEHPARDTWNEVKIKTRRTTLGIVRRTTRRRLVRLLAGQMLRSLTLPISVALRRDLPSWTAKRLYLMTKWRVDGVVAAGLVAGLQQTRKK